MTDIMFMLRQAQAQAQKTQGEENNSVATFFNCLANSKQSTNPSNTQSMPIPIKSNQMTLESIERNIPKISPPPPNHDTQNITGSQKNDLANSPLAQFINSNNLNVLRGAQEVKNNNGSVISCSKPITVTASQAVSNGIKETKTKETKLLITPNDLLTNGKSSNTGDKKLPKQQQKPEPLTQAQLMQSLKYLIDNDSDFTKKIHDAYIKSVNKK